MCPEDFSLFVFHDAVTPAVTCFIAGISCARGDVKTRVVLGGHLGEGVSFGFDGILSNTPDTRQ